MTSRPRWCRMAFRRLSRSNGAVAALILFGVFPGRLPAQTPAQLEALRSHPDLVRERIRASGLTPQEIRERLRAAGLPVTLLDPFLLPANSSDSVLQALRQVLDGLRLETESDFLPAEIQGLERVP